MKPLIALFSILINCLVMGQNLVPNPSFEEYTECPSVFLITGLNSWSSYRGTPDYYNVCAEEDLSTPCNLSGCQEPSSGKGYIGLSAFHTGSYMDGTPFREVAGAQLSEPLAVGQTYYISFKTSAVFGGYFVNNSFSSKLGVKFSMTSYVYDFNNPQLSATVDNISHIYSADIIADTNNWTTVSGNFVADMPYQYIMLGNFFDNDNTDTTLLHEETSTIKSYYFIDDVCVTINPQGCDFTSAIEKISDSKLEIYPNPVSEVMQINFQNIGDSDITLFDIFGQKVLVSTNQGYNSATMNVNGLSNGIYILNIKEKSGITLSKKIIIENQ